MHDDLGNRMKAHYENRVRYHLSRRTTMIIRTDGRSFHTFARKCKRPFDDDLMADMDATALAMCEHIPGACFGYVQSDEINIIVCDFDTIQTEAWFDGNIQKIASISASMATAAFNQQRSARFIASILNEGNPVKTDKIVAEYMAQKPAQFDSRAFAIPDPVEVVNYAIWRQQDATRNSLQMVAQSQFSHSQLQGKNVDQLQEMLWQERGINWNDFPVGQKRGRFVDHVVTTRDMEYTDKRTGETRRRQGVERKEWRIVDPPIFTQDRDFLVSRMPLLV